MNAQSKFFRFAKSLWFALGVLLIFALVFAVYVWAEKQIDRANENRFQTYLLSNELRQSSEDLTRMARTYVATGDPVYKKYYQEIVDIRDGKVARPKDYGSIYWDLVLTDDARPRFSSGQFIALLDLLQQADISKEEFAKLAQAKANSDELTHIEWDAMHLVESDQYSPQERQAKAIAMLHDATYHLAKANIMHPIYDFDQLVEERTADRVEGAVKLASRLRYFFIILCLTFAFVLWRSYQILRWTLGASVGQLKQYLETMGQGNFAQELIVPKGNPTSIVALLQGTQSQLAQIESNRQETELRNRRLTQFYNVLSQCNQAIVRSHNEQELFQQVCENLVQHGGIQMTWVGMIDTASGLIIPIASAGTGVDYIEKTQFSIDSKHPYGNGPSGIAARDAHPIWCQYFMDSTITKPWQGLAAEYGWNSSASIPLFKNGMVYGILNLYANLPNAFDEEIRYLIAELTMDLSFALNRFELEAGRQRSQQLESVRSYMLERITSDIGISQLFHDVAHYLESIMPNSLCSILLLDEDGVHLRIGATPSLPEFFSQAIDGVQIGDGVGSCGHAMHSGTRTIVEEIAHHPYWINFKDVAAKANLAACWSEPIRSSSNRILGAFAVYHRVPTKPDTTHIALLEMAAHFLAIAIERNQNESKLIKLSQAVEQSPNVVIITDINARIEYVNQAFVEKTGFTLAEVQGKSPSILHSGKTSLFTYHDMWDKLKHGENWQGELINRSASGREYVELAHISPVIDANGKVTHFLSIQEDITEKKRTEERIQYLAHYDVLTGLPNRILLEEHARMALSSAKRTTQSLAVVFFDLDHFKNINDSLGHSTGDAMLVELAIRLRDILREEDTISRLGGDEFILLLSGANEAGAERVAEKLLETVNQTFHVGQYELNVSASIGISMFPDDGEDLESLLKNADAAMYRAKQEGRNQVCFFTQEMQARSSRHLELVNALRHALERNQFHVLYQPQIDLRSGAVIGVEALLRWTHNELGSVSPAEFIPVAEETGLILSIGEWVIRTAVQQVKSWHLQGWNNLIAAVNLSVIQFRHSDLPGTVTQILHEAELPAHFLELELTEGVAMSDPPGAIAIMNDLHERGVRMSIDDFGTGYSSLSYLKKFKVYKLKIDQSFVRDIGNDPEDRAIVSAIISMAQSLGLQTIAEGVETQEQVDFLRQQFCDEVQGYHFARPLTPAQFDAFMRERQSSI
jgi:diguanylate cyclase (GGDEF)-like protein/PAS domain S-box-containing protein